MNRKLLATIFLLAVAVLCIPILGSDGSDACTGFYVGSDVSESGNTIIGQTCDFLPYNPVALHYFEASDKPGHTIDGYHGFSYPLPDHTYGFSGSYFVYIDTGIGCDGSGSVNECGLAVTGSITTYSNDAALAADPLVEAGLGEDCMSWIAASCASNARDAVILIAGIIDSYGSSENNIYMFADKNEAWFMEVYTGHQYLAVKLPTDKVAFFGNETCITHISDYTEYIASKDLLKLPVEHGFAVFDDGEMNIMKTYAIPFDDSSHMRTWIGHHILAPSLYSSEYDDEMVYDHLFAPDDAVSVKDIMELTRNRYEGTPYCPDDTGESKTVVGTETTAEAHILEIDKSLPDEMSVTRWSCIGPTVYNAYIPISSWSSKFNEAFENYGTVQSIDMSSAYAVFKMLNLACSEERFSEAGTNLKKDLVSKGVKMYMGDLEDYYIEVWPQIVGMAMELYNESPDKAKDYLNRCSEGMLHDMFDEVKALYDETVLRLADKATARNPRPSYYPMVDASHFAERYGWTSVVDGDTLTLSIDGYQVAITADDRPYMEAGTVTTPEGTEEMTVHRVGDSFRIALWSLDFIKEKGKATPVDYPAGEGGSGSVDPLIIGAVVAVLVICAAAFLLVRKK